VTAADAPTARVAGVTGRGRIVVRRLVVVVGGSVGFGIGITKNKRRPV